jgi:hypothetical protein
LFELDGRCAVDSFLYFRNQCQNIRSSCLAFMYDEIGVDDRDPSSTYRQPLKAEIVDDLAG